MTWVVTWRDASEDEGRRVAISRISSIGGYPAKGRMERRDLSRDTPKRRVNQLQKEVVQLTDCRSESRCRPVGQRLVVLALPRSKSKMGASGQTQKVTPSGGAPLRLASSGSRAAAFPENRIGP